MIPGKDFNNVDPKTVYDILWSWNFGYVSDRGAIELMALDDLSELYQAAHDNDVPYPGQPSERDIQQADEFISAIRGAA